MPSSTGILTYINTSSGRRDQTVICVVEQPVDLLSVERTSEFRGLYHVLGGALSPLDGVEPEHLRIDELIGRGEREELLAVAPRQVRDRANDALAPEQLVRERRDVAHVDAGANDHACLAHGAQRRRDERADGREDDRGVE